VYIPAKTSPAGTTENAPGCQSWVGLGAGNPLIVWNRISFTENRVDWKIGSQHPRAVQFTQD
jgi:hypothetical protein